MTRVQVIECDGCGASAVETGAGELGWVRIEATSNEPGESFRTHFLDACATECLQTVVAKVPSALVLRIDSWRVGAR